MEHVVNKYITKKKNHKVSCDKISLKDMSDYIYIYDKQHNEFTDTSEPIYWNHFHMS
jgi:hypothetical protein